MLIPDNIHPEHTIYYNGAFVLKTLQKYHAGDIFDLFENTIKEHKMSMPIFILCIDWLFLLNLININDKGQLELCT